MARKRSQEGIGESPGSQAPAAGTPAYRGIWQGRGWEPVSVPWGLRRRGVGWLGDELSLTCQGAHLVVSLDVSAAAYQTFLDPPSHAPPCGAEGGGLLVGVRRPGPAGPVRPGAPVAWGACHIEKAGSSGAGTAVGGRMPWYQQTHKYRLLTGGRRRARVCGQLAREGEPGTGRESPAPSPSLRLTVLGWLGASPPPAGPLGAGEQTGAGGKGWGEGGSGCAGAGQGVWGSPRQDGMPMGG